MLPERYRMIPDRASNAEQWEFDKLVTILLRQFKGLLAQRNVELNDSDMRQLGEEVASRTAESSKLQPICDALNDIVHESVNKLDEWELTFAQALKTEMADMPNWESTAEFLEVANEKINAEVRISAGASLMVALGDKRHAQFLLEAINHDLKTHGKLDVDAVIAKHALVFASQVDLQQDDWLKQARTWIETE